MLGLKLSRLGTLYRTLKYLRFVQFFYRVKYAVRTKLGKKLIYKGKIPQAHRLSFSCLADSPESLTCAESSFTFLNVTHDFGSLSSIDWNLPTYGKLWTYNLNYFEFLHLKNLSVEHKQELIRHYIINYHQLKDGLEPYPTSLRIINWIRFVNQNDVRDSEIDMVVCNELYRLSHSLEYHLLGNHLLENGFALLMGGVYFKHAKFLKLAVSILSKELNEQTMNDGMHFERSVMYHCIILNRVLEAFDLLSSNEHEARQDFAQFLEITASRMLGFLFALRCTGDRIPLFNDSAQDISFSPRVLIERAEKLSIEPAKVTLGESGFRTFVDGKLIVFMNLGGIAPSYQPGHAHADTFTYELHYDGEPLIIEKGTSTYEANSRRSIERATSSHNTICINGLNSSEVWGGFRVGRRASVTSLLESKDVLEAIHSGYKHIGIRHKRSFQLNSTNTSLTISDSLYNLKSADVAYSYIHFYPGVELELSDDTLVVNNGTLTLQFNDFHSLHLEEYEHALGFNNRAKAQKVCGQVFEESKLTIRYEN